MWIKTGLAILAGLIGGAMLAALLVFGPFEIGGTAAGPWKTNLLIGDSAASPTVRAAIARRGLLALNRSETVYFNATSDDSGQRLRAYRPLTTGRSGLLDEFTPCRAFRPDPAPVSTGCIDQRQPGPGGPAPD